MKNNYILQCGHFRYEVTPEVQKVLEGIMYWEHCKRLDSEELRVAEKDRKSNGEKSSYTEQDIANLRHAVEEEQASCIDFMNRMEKLNVPNWVGNGAMEWARTHDLRKYYFNDFFEKSQYAAKHTIAKEER